MRGRRIFYLQVAFFLFAFCIGILILMKLVSDLKDSSADLSRQINARSTAILEKFKLTHFRKPDPGDPQLFSPREKERRLSHLLDRVLFRQQSSLGAAQGCVGPLFSEPMKGFSDVMVLSSSRRMFLSRIDDGATSR